MKHFAPLSPKDCLYLAGVFVLGFGWLLIDQWFLPSVITRFLALIVILLLLFYLQFRITKPENIFQYVNSLIAVSLSLIVLISLIVHVLINDDFNYISLLIWLVSGTIPYLAAYIYKRSKRDLI